VTGQLSVLVVIVVFIRFFIFADSPSSKKDYPSHVREKRQLQVLQNRSADVRTILEKTYYNVETHSAESLDWFTVLIGQAISQFRDDARTNDNLLRSLTDILNSDKIPDYVDSIRVTELNIGDDYPIFSNCKINSDGENGLEAQIDVDLSDTLTLGVETRLLLNYPKSMLAVLPVSLAVSIVRFTGKLTVAFRRGAPEDDSPTAGKTYLIFSFDPDYRLEFNVESLVGARSRLQNVPKIGQLVESKLRKWFVDRCVAPRYQQVPLPTLWPRSKNTKEQAPTQRTLGERQSNPALREDSGHNTALDSTTETLRRRSPAVVPVEMH
jgi:maintenance of morphology protein 1